MSPSMSPKRYKKKKKKLLVPTRSAYQPNAHNHSLQISVCTSRMSVSRRHTSSC
jgi:hypothetical protein